MTTTPHRRLPLGATLLACLLAFPAAAQQLALGSVSTAPGETAQVPLALGATAGTVVALQADVGYDQADLTPGVAVLAPGLVTDHRLASSVVSPGTLRLVLYSPTNQPLPDSALVSLPFTLVGCLPPGPRPLTLAAAVLGDRTAQAVAATLGDGSIGVTDPPAGALVADAGTSATWNGGAGVTVGGSPTASGGTLPYFYDWSPAESVSDPEAANPIASPGDTTVYTLELSDGAGCVTTDDVTVTVIPCSVCLEGDIAPRPSGNAALTIGDWVQGGRFAAALDTAVPGSEFQRADCAPAATGGDGMMSVADWVQAGRYGAALDPPVPAGGPTVPGFAPGKDEPTARVTAGTVVVSAGSVAVDAGQEAVVAITVEGSGDPAAAGHSLRFDPALLAYVSATAGPGASGATLRVNEAKAALGRLGIAAAMPPGQRLPLEDGSLLVVRFAPTPAAARARTSVAFLDQPVGREVVDLEAVPIAASYGNATVTVGVRAGELLQLVKLQGRDVLLDFSGLPGAPWQAFKDLAKEQLGSTPLLPAPTDTTAVDAGAVDAAPALVFYQVRLR